MMDFDHEDMLNMVWRIAAQTLSRHANPTPEEIDGVVFDVAASVREAQFKSMRRALDKNMRALIDATNQALAGRPPRNMRWTKAAAYDYDYRDGE